MNYACLRLHCNRDNEIITLMQCLAFIETHTHTQTKRSQRLKWVGIVEYRDEEEEDR